MVAAQTASLLGAKGDNFSRRGIAMQRVAPAWIALALLRMCAGNPRSRKG
jgi:hypothetical protein